MNVSSSAAFTSAPLCGGPSMTEVPGFRFALYPGGNGLLGSSDTGVVHEKCSFLPSSHGIVLGRTKHGSGAVVQLKGEMDVDEETVHVAGFAEGHVLSRDSLECPQHFVIPHAKRRVSRVAERSEVKRRTVHGSAWPRNSKLAARISGDRFRGSTLAAAVLTHGNFHCSNLGHGKGWCSSQALEILGGGRGGFRAAARLGWFGFPVTLASLALNRPPCPSSWQRSQHSWGMIPGNRRIL